MIGVAVVYIFYIISPITNTIINATFNNETFQEYSLDFEIPEDGCELNAFFNLTRDRDHGIQLNEWNPKEDFKDDLIDFVYSNLKNFEKEPIEIAIVLNHFSRYYNTCLNYYQNRDDDIEQIVRWIDTHFRGGWNFVKIDATVTLMNNSENVKKEVEEVSNINTLIELAYGIGCSALGIYITSGTEVQSSNTSSNNSHVISMTVKETNTFTLEEVNEFFRDEIILVMGLLGKSKATEDLEDVFKFATKVAVILVEAQKHKSDYTLPFQDIIDRFPMLPIKMMENALQVANANLTSNASNVKTDNIYFIAEMNQLYMVYMKTSRGRKIFQKFILLSIYGYIFKYTSIGYRNKIPQYRNWNVGEKNITKICLNDVIFLMSPNFWIGKYFHENYESKTFEYKRVINYILQAYDDYVQDVTGKNPNYNSYYELEFYQYQTYVPEILKLFSKVYLNETNHLDNIWMLKRSLAYQKIIPKFIFSTNSEILGAVIRIHPVLINNPYHPVADSRLYSFAIFGFGIAQILYKEIEGYHESCKKPMAEYNITDANHYLLLKASLNILYKATKKFIMFESNNQTSHNSSETIDEQLQKFIRILNKVFNSATKEDPIFGKYRDLFNAILQKSYAFNDAFNCFKGRIMNDAYIESCLQKVDITTYASDKDYSNQTQGSGYD